MREIGPSSEDEMILAFVRAEFHSPRFKPLFRKALGGDANLVYRPRLDDPEENRARKNALAMVRGYGVNKYLFTNFPTDATWIRLACTRDDIGAMKYANHPTWTTLSHGSRLVRDGSANVESTPTGEDVNDHVLAVVREIAQGRTFAELIVAAEDEDAVPILVEGHARATAYVRALPANAEVEVITARAPDLSRWSFY